VRSSFVIASTVPRKRKETVVKKRFLPIHPHSLLWHKICKLQERMEGPKKSSKWTPLGGGEHDVSDALFMVPSIKSI
jgi:hypothetical protein